MAADFTNHDQHAVRQINRNIELMRYRHFGDDLLLLQLVNASSATPPGSTMTITSIPSASTSSEATPAASPMPRNAYASQEIEHRLAQASQPIKDLFEALKSYLLALSDDVQFKQVKYDFAFRRMKEFRVR